MLGRFWASLDAVVDSTCKAHPGNEPQRIAERIAVRDSLYGDARERLVHELGPQLRTISLRAVERVRLDNAVLMSRRVYLTDLDAFDAVLDQNGGDLRRAIQAVIAAAKSDKKKPFDALNRAVSQSPLPAR